MWYNYKYTIPCNAWSKEKTLIKLFKIILLTLSGIPFNNSHAANLSVSEL
jgi:hypothetical protein